MSWGNARRPKISNRIGRPSPREGGDGDTQVVATKTGTKLLTKWAGRWLGTDNLKTAEKERAGVFTPSVWQTTVQTDADAGSLYVYIPDFITQDNFVTVEIAVEYKAGGDAEYWLISKNGGAPIVGGDAVSIDNVADLKTALANFTAQYYSVNLYWAARRLELFILNGETASLFEETNVMVSFFFKD